jgi:hypothetical protein
MSSRSVSDIQTRAEDANVLSYLKNDPSYVCYEFIGEVILKINIV